MKNSTGMNDGVPAALCSSWAYKDEVGKKRKRRTTGKHSICHFPLSSKKLETFPQQPLPEPDQSLPPNLFYLEPQNSILHFIEETTRYPNMQDPLEHFRDPTKDKVIILPPPFKIEH